MAFPWSESRIPPGYHVCKLWDWNFQLQGQGSYQDECTAAFIQKHVRRVSKLIGSLSLPASTPTQLEMVKWLRAVFPPRVAPREAVLMNRKLIKLQASSFHRDEEQGGHSPQHAVDGVTYVLYFPLLAFTSHCPLNLGHLPFSIIPRCISGPH